MHGDPCEYPNENPALPKVCNGVVVVRSLLWPGAYSFYYKGEVKQVYLGSGHKFERAGQYYPVQPPQVLEDPEEYQDGPEPTPLEAPPVEE